MKRVQLKGAMFHPERGRFDFIKINDSDYIDKKDHIIIKSAASGIKYDIPKANIAYVSSEYRPKRDCI